MRTQTGKIYKCLDRLRNLHICFIHFFPHQQTDERGRSVFIPLLIHHKKITDPVTSPLNPIYLSLSLRFTGLCHWKSWLRFFWVAAALQEEAALLTGGALCGGLFPALTGSAHIGNRFSLRDDLRRSPAEKRSQLPLKNRGRGWGRVQLWNSSPSSNRERRLFHSIYYSFCLTTAYFLSLPLSSPSHCLSLLRFHCWVLLGCFKCQHTGAAPRWRSYPSPGTTVGEP